MRTHTVHFHRRTTQIAPAALCTAAIALSVHIGGATETRAPAAVTSGAGAQGRAPGATWELADATAPPCAGEAPYAHAATWWLPPDLTDGQVDIGTVRPLDVALGQSGQLYVADGRNNVVLAFQDGVDTPAVWGPPRELASGRSLTVPGALSVDRRSGDVHILWRSYTGTFAGHGELTGARLVSASVQTRHPDGSIPHPPFPVPAGEDLTVDPDTGNLALQDGGACMVWLLAPDDGAVVGRVSLRTVSCWNRRLTAAPGGVMAAVQNTGAVVVFRADGELHGGLALRRNRAVDVSADAAGQLHVLVVEEAVPAVVMTFDAWRRLVGVRTGADLGVPKLPGASEWPWAIDVDGSGATVALTTADERFGAYRISQSQGARRWLKGDVLQPLFQLYDPMGRESGDTSLAVASTVDGGLVVLDGMTPDLWVLQRAGRAGRVAARPRRAREMALGAAGEVYVVTADDEVLRLDAEAGSPTWRQPCDCSLGGRLAVRGDRLYVSRPRARSVRALDVASGEVLGELTVDQPVGLWPEDVAAREDALLTADLLSGVVQSWSAADRLAGQWAAGVLLGPVRLDISPASAGELAVAALMPDGQVQLHAAADGRLMDLWRPALGDGALLSPADLALTTPERLFLADADRRAVHVFEKCEPAVAVATSVPATPAATPSASPTLAPESCVVVGNKEVAPTRLLLGQTARVTLNLTADCPAAARLAGADILLLVDQSSSMRGVFGAAREAAISFAARTDVRHHRLGVVTFSDRAILVRGLTHDLDTVIAALERLNTVSDDGATDGLAALVVAEDHFEQALRADAAPVVVLLSDGQYGGAPDPSGHAAAMRTRGVRFYSIGLGGGPDAKTLTDIAGSPERYFHAPGSRDLLGIYQEVLRMVLAQLAGNLVVRDDLGQDMELVPGSVAPAAVEEVASLRWGSVRMPAGALTLSYTVRPGRAGLLPVNRQAVADYTDSDGCRRQYVFPVPVLEVLGPSPTATSSATRTLTPSSTPTASASPSPIATTTPTPSPTPVPRPLYMPVAVAEAKCSPRQRRLDVALVIDASSSMQERTTAGRTKLDAARAAAATFLDALRLAEGDRAAIVAFHREARLLAGLTSDRAELGRSLAAIAVDTQTRIDLGIELAHLELVSCGSSASRAAMIVLTDGYANPVPASVAVARATEAKADGVWLFTVGLGVAVDLPSLQQIASSPSDCHHAPHAEDLEDIYRKIASQIPCPADQYWPRR